MLGNLRFLLIAMLLSWVPKTSSGSELNTNFKNIVSQAIQRLDEYQATPVEKLDPKKNEDLWPAFYSLTTAKSWMPENDYRAVKEEFCRRMADKFTPGHFIVFEMFQADVGNLMSDNNAAGQALMIEIFNHMDSTKQGKILAVLNSIK